MKLKIFFANEQDNEKITYSLKMLVRRAIEATLAFEDVNEDCNVSVTFTDDEGIRSMNSEFRGIDRSTDVLSFPLLDEGDPYVPGRALELGDIVLNLGRAKAQGFEFGHGFERETAFLVIHSTLHLLGYDHETGDEDEADMRARQSTIADICGFGIKNTTEVK
ncbi:MAG: rRNA maturation RNase YbeY [Clostridia bacterium]|nr:rRNA maturation RNase YbeY [Clostridia bacterium]